MVHIFHPIQEHTTHKRHCTNANHFTIHNAKPDTLQRITVYKTDDTEHIINLLTVLEKAIRKSPNYVLVEKQSQTN